TVMKFMDGTWQIIGNAGFSAGGALTTSLAISHDSVPYVAYVDNGNEAKATVMIYNSITTASLSGTYCPGAPVLVSYTAKGYYRNNNSFTAQLSNYAGNFATPVNISTPV